MISCLVHSLNDDDDHHHHQERKKSIRTQDLTQTAMMLNDNDFKKQILWEFREQPLWVGRIGQHGS